MLEHFGRYTRRGVNLGLGTDTLSLKMLEEMRTALMASHLSARDVHTADPGVNFHAAKIGGATAQVRETLVVWRQVPRLSSC